MNLKKYISDSPGECIAVDYQESRRRNVNHSLGPYHPVACDRVVKYCAETKMRRNGTIQLKVQNWDQNIIRDIAQLQFSYNDITGKLTAPAGNFGTFRGWELVRWEMEIEDYKNCSNQSPSSVKSMSDTLTWRRINPKKVQKLYECKQEAKQILTQNDGAIPKNNQRFNKILKQLIEIDLYYPEINTSWRWIFNSKD